MLWTIAILAMLVAAAQSLSFNSARMERRQLDDAQMDATFDAAIMRAVLGLSDARADRRWRVDGVTQDFEFGGYPLHIAIQDEFGRVDLNAADGSLLRQLLRSAGGTQTDSEALTDRILDWRQRDDGTSRLHGATDDLYANAGLAYRPRHGPFQTVEELRLVLGMTSSLFARIEPALTVYSHHPAIDTAVAPRGALLAYYPDQPERVADILKARAEASDDASGGKPGTIPLAESLIGRTFDISIVTSMGKRKVNREAVVMLTNSSDRPYLVLQWR